MPAEANIAKERVSILTPMGAALYGLAEGYSIDWPDLYGNLRRLRIIRVLAPDPNGSRVVSRTNGEADVVGREHRSWPVAPKFTPAVAQHDSPFFGRHSREPIRPEESI